MNIKKTSLLICAIIIIMGMGYEKYALLNKNSIEYNQINTQRIKTLKEIQSLKKEKNYSLNYISNNTNVFINFLKTFSDKKNIKYKVRTQRKYMSFYAYDIIDLTIEDYININDIVNLLKKSNTLDTLKIKEISYINGNINIKIYIFGRWK